MRSCSAWRGDNNRPSADHARCAGDTTLPGSGAFWQIPAPTSACRPTASNCSRSRSARLPPTPSCTATAAPPSRSPAAPSPSRSEYETAEPAWQPKSVRRGPTPLRSVAVACGLRNNSATGSTSTARPAARHRQRTRTTTGPHGGPTHGRWAVPCLPGRLVRHRRLHPVDVRDS